MSDHLTRNAVVAFLGTPDRTEGTLNDPVEREEYGIKFNERWIYEHLTGDPAGIPMRTVYWHRYDFMGTMVRASAAEEWRHDTTLAEALKDADRRLAPLDPARHQPNEASRRYRSVSLPTDAHDLGGYVQKEEDVKD
jgi:hypothetical protein